MQSQTLTAGRTASYSAAFGWLDTALARWLLGTPGRTLLLVAGLAAGVAVLRTAGHANFTLVHYFYLPVLLAAHWFYARAGIVTGLLAGLLSSPLFMGDAIPAGQADHAWLIRTAFYAAIGGGAGILRRLLVERTHRLEGTVRDLTRTYTRTLQSLIGLLEHHDEETSSHCERVAYNARTVGSALGFAKRDLETLYWAGYLHDVGKLATPAKMLLKDGPLEPHEYEIMKQHAEIGGDTIMAIAPAFEQMAHAIRSHHERWDGRGYPDGLAGEQIPQFGRILAVVDAFEAMTSDRPYRKAMIADAAKQILEEEAGKQFDPRIVRVFLTLLGNDRLHLEKVHGRHTRGPTPSEITADFLTESPTYSRA